MVEARAIAEETKALTSKALWSGELSAVEDFVKAIRCSSPAAATAAGAEAEAPPTPPTPSLPDRLHEDVREKLQNFVKRRESGPGEVEKLLEMGKEAGDFYRKFLNKHDPKKEEPKEEPKAAAATPRKETSSSTKPKSSSATPSLGAFCCSHSCSCGKLRGCCTSGHKDKHCHRGGIMPRPWEEHPKCPLNHSRGLIVRRDFERRSPGEVEYHSHTGQRSGSARVPGLYRGIALHVGYHS